MVRRIDMVHSVLLHVEQPAYGTVETINWQSFLPAARTIANQSTKIDTLGEVSWLINLHDALDVFVALVHAVQAHK